MLLAASVWSAVVLNAVRFGLRSRMSLPGLGLTALLVTMACLKAQPSISSIAAAAVSAYVAICLGVPSLRVPVLRVIAAAGAYAGVFYGMVRMIHYPSINVGIAATTLCLGWLISFLMEAFTLTYIDRHTGPEKLRNA